MRKDSCGRGNNKGADAGFYQYMASRGAVPTVKKRRNTGAIVFSVIFSAVLLIGIMTLVLAGIYEGVSPIRNIYSESELPQEDISAPEVTDKGENDISIKTASHSGMEILSSVELVSRCSDSVVRVEVCYDGEVYGYGSGIVIGTNSEETKTYIVTCAHLLTDECTYNVVTSDTHSYSALVVGSDINTDTAVLSVSEVGFSPASFGVSRQVESGESVVAIGNIGSGSPYYVTSGIISSPSRYVQSETEGFRFLAIQHDAAINPGSSGGALFNMYGQVVGMNSSKVVSTEYEGVGFAVPSDTLVSVVSDIVNLGAVARGKLSVTYTYVDPQTAHRYSLPAYSVKIDSIGSDSDLSGKAESGDFITAVNGERLDEEGKLISAVDSLRTGDELELEIVRISHSGESEKFVITVKLVDAD